VKDIAVVDAGPLYSAASRRDTDHARCVELFNRLQARLYVPVLVIAEVAHFVARHLGSAAETALIQSLVDQTTIVSPDADDWLRILELLRQYQDLGIGVADASVIALAERLNTDLIITLDRRHFRAVRPKHVDAFRLLPG
jgi:predicted nucleic acid-binding protein